jgi:hypothetical protein
LSEKNTPATKEITPEEIRAVYCNQASFILSASGIGPEGQLLRIFDMVNCFYSYWEIARVARVEISVKVCGKGILRKRYTVPVNPYFEMDADMMNRMLECMNVPHGLLDFINGRHGERIRMGVGIDHDRGIKKVYFSEGEKNIYAYGFREDGRYGAKIYRILRDGNNEQVMSCVRSIFDPGTSVDDIAALFPENGRYLVYDRFVLEDGREIPSGFHISPPEKKRIADLREPLTHLARLCLPDLDEYAFNSWINRTSAGFLFWVGLGKDRGGNMEMSLYVRNIDS